jgi:hypothetical protein
MRPRPTTPGSAERKGPRVPRPGRRVAPEEISRMFNKVQTEFGRLDIL